MEQISFITAFTTGLLTFFAPCTFIALPSFLAYITSQATQEVDGVIVNSRSRILTSALFYAFGFLTVFVLLGLTATSIGNLFLRNKELFTQIGGFLMILGGLFMLFGDKFKNLQFLYKEKKFHIKDQNRYIKGHLFPFTIGLTTALAWTPCVGPVLGGILFLAGTSSESPLYGASLLLVHGLGIMLPFLLIAFFFEKAEVIVKKFGKYSKTIYIVSALILIVIGLSLLTGTYDLIGQQIYKVYHQLGLDFLEH